MTKNNRHIIRKQVLEIEVEGQEQVVELQRVLGRLFRARLLPIISQTLDKHSPPNTLHRIEKLVIDLGEIPLENLGKGMEDLFKRQFEKQFLAAIQKITLNVQSNAPTSAGVFGLDKPLKKRGETTINLQSATELFFYFLQTACLPWWAKASPRLLEETLEALLENPTTLAFHQQLTYLLKQEKYRKRLVNNFSDTALLQLANSLGTGSISSKKLEIYLQKWIAHLQILSVQLQASSSNIRFVFWESVLLVLLNPTTATSNNFATYFSKKMVHEFEKLSRFGEIEVEQILKKIKSLPLSGDLLEENEQPQQKEEKVLLEEEKYRKQIINEFSDTALLQLANSLGAGSISSKKLEIYLQKWIAHLQILSVQLHASPSNIRFVFWESVLLVLLNPTTATSNNFATYLSKKMVYEFEKLSRFGEIEVEQILKKIKSLPLSDDLLEENKQPQQQREKVLLEEEKYRKQIINEFSDTALLQLANSLGTGSISSKKLEIHLQKWIAHLQILSVQLQASPSNIRFVFWESVLLVLLNPTTATSNNFATYLSKKMVHEFEKLSRFGEIEVEQILKKINNLPLSDDLLEGEPPLLMNTKFSQSKEIYIENTGLVLVWVFINTFFERLGWVANKVFVSKELQHRAIWMLQYLVSSETAPLEYQLALNKLLCGLKIQDVLEPQEALSEEEQAACKELLEVVLEYASGLGNISIEGFQQSFLQREGVLTLKDNTWTLQVEKETFDIVLSRLAWDYHIVKLPWMETIIYVEW